MRYIPRHTSLVINSSFCTFICDESKISYWPIFRKYWNNSICLYLMAIYPTSSWLLYPYRPVYTCGQRFSNHVCIDWAPSAFIKPFLVPIYISWLLIPIARHQFVCKTTGTIFTIFVCRFDNGIQVDRNPIQLCYKEHTKIYTCVLGSWFRVTLWQPSSEDHSCFLYFVNSLSIFRLSAISNKIPRLDVNKEVSRTFQFGYVGELHWLMIFTTYQI